MLTYQEYKNWEIDNLLVWMEKDKDLWKLAKYCLDQSNWEIDLAAEYFVWKVCGDSFKKITETPDGAEFTCANTYPALTRWAKRNK